MLTRRRRTEVLVEGGRVVALELAALIEGEAAVVDVSAPRQGLVMCEVRETARNSRFYLGEALMSESRVRIGSTDGLGVVLGDDDELARALAVIDAAYALPEPPACLAEVTARILNAEQALAQRRERAERRVAASRVSFDTMQGQDRRAQGVVR
jgi:alpha-D-ribose 1-methylphosphonate 5-triphosphate synthase subunit PhnG